MDTLLIEVTNQKALGLLHELEELHLIRVIKNGNSGAQKLSEKFAGKLNLSKEEYNDFQEHISRSRNEWDNNSL